MLFIRSFAFCCLFFVAHYAYAQSGCTDPAATNYNAAALTNDGSCLYPVTHQDPVLRGALNPIITESSGLIFSDGKLWTHNDSGNLPEIYSVDTTDCHTLQTVIIDNYPNVDWEDITADSNYIYVGDHGNNNGSRTDLKVLKIAKSDITSGSTVHVNAQAISFSYNDQTSFIPSSTNNFDCEALISIKDSLYVFTKDRGDRKTRAYKMPKTPGTYALDPYTGFNVAGLITGADYNNTTHEIVLIGYLPGHTNSFLWYLSDYQGDMFFSGNKRRIEISNGKEWQTEGVAWQSATRVFISCETTDSIPASLYVSNAFFTPTLVKNNNYAALPNIYPNPTSDLLHIDNVIAKTNYRVTTTDGRLVTYGTLNPGNNTISFTALITGLYFIDITAPTGERSYFRFEKN